jgi:hypothetical protein
MMSRLDFETEIASVLGETGPLTGFELWKILGGERIEIWRTCMTSGRVEVRRSGVDYLRLDRRIDGYARLSPSMLRGFLTYSVVGLRGDRNIPEKARLNETRIREVSRAKMELAFNVVSGIIERLDEGRCLAGRLCAIIAGDVVFGMAHDMPRPERSTRRIVNGSDMDLVFVTADDVPGELRRLLDEAVYEEKARLLMAPHLREEIDYVVKDMARVAEQTRFDTFPRMVACKILNEGKHLYGSASLFQTVKNMLREKAVTGRLEAMERDARRFRQAAERELLMPGAPGDAGTGRFLFYPIEESEEFE